VPRISAGTVAEHRARQRQVLLAAARDLLVDGGYPALTFAALARRAGLARPSVYAYFRTREEVVVALCEVELPAVGAEVVRAVADAESPRDRLEAYVRAQLAAVGDDQFRLAHVLADAPLSTSARAHIGRLHRELIPDAVPILTELGNPRPRVAALLLQGLLTTAVTAIDDGVPADQVVEATVDTALDGLAR